jgi:hypothetical protein
MLGTQSHASASNDTLEGYLELHAKTTDLRNKSPNLQQAKATPTLKAKLYDFTAVDAYEQQSSRKNQEKKSDLC